MIIDPIIAVDLVIAGTPVARPRARVRAIVSKRSGKPMAVAYHPTKVTISRKTGKPTPDSVAWVKSQAWYEAVRFAALPFIPTQPWQGPVRVDSEVYFERPKYMQAKKWSDGPIPHTAKPDRDNLDKSILDSLTAAGLYADDAQVCQGGCSKYYVARGHSPGVLIRAKLLSSNEGNACLF